MYYNMKREKMRAKSKTIPIWKLWHPECKDEPKKRVDRRRSKLSKQLTQMENENKIKLKDNKMTNLFKVTGTIKWTNKSPMEYQKKEYYLYTQCWWLVGYRL